MPYALETSIVQILSTEGVAVGTGFLISKSDQLVVTCAHVIESMGGTIRMQFNGSDEIHSAQVIPDYHRSPDKGDIAFLRLENVPVNSVQLQLGTAEHSLSGNPFLTFGYPKVGDVQGVYARGEILGIAIENGRRLLQLRSMELNNGHSGAPVWDENRNVAVGMVVSVYKADANGKLRDTAFAITSDDIWLACPEIHPFESPPYLGLKTFADQTAQFFFGRETLTKKLINILRSGTRFLALFGPSGSGKSSLVRAGVLWALKRGQLPGSENWAQIIMRPADNPFEQLAASSLDLTNINDYLKSNPDIDRIVLFIDQFEELFTISNDNSREHFIKNLAVALNNTKLILIISMRDEFYSAFHAKTPQLAESEHLRIENVPGTLKHSELAKMIVEPAARSGLVLEEGLVDVIVKDLSHDGQPRSSTLPLLEFTLLQLWEKRSEGRLTHDAYQLIGGVTGSLARWADDAYSELPKGFHARAENLLTSLVHLGDEALGLPDTRKRGTLDNADEKTQYIFQYLIDKRLLVSSGSVVEYIHDSLIHEWGKLRIWIKKDRENLRLLQGISEAASVWEKSGRDESLLNHRGGRLTDALALYKNDRFNLQSIEQSYLNSCLEDQQRLNRQKESLRRQIVAGLVIFSVAVLITALFAIQKWKQAEAQARISRANELAGYAANWRSKDFLTSLLLSIEAYNTADTTQTKSELLSNVQVEPNFLGYINDTGYFTTLEFSPNGHILADGNSTGVILWDVATHKRIGTPLQGHTDDVNDVAFSPDGNILASASSDQNIILWDVNSHEQITLLPMRHSSSVQAVAFNHDGSILASGDSNGKIVLWSIQTFDPITSFVVKGEKTIENLVFSPDGHLLISSQTDGSAIFWDLTTYQAMNEANVFFVGSSTSVSFGENSNDLILAGSLINAITLVEGKTKEAQTIETDTAFGIVALSPNGKILAAETLSGNVTLWDIGTKKVIHQFFVANNNSVYSLAFSSDSRYLAFGNSNHTITLWDLEPLSYLCETIRGTGSINDISYNPANGILASAGDDGIINFWNTVTKKPISEPLVAHDDGVTTIDFSPDGRLLASGGRDQAVLLWDVAKQTPISEPLLGHTSWFNRINSVRFSPDGKLLASGDADGVIIFWDVNTQQNIKKLYSEKGYLDSIVFNSDGSILVASKKKDKFGYIELWDVEEGTLIDKIDKQFVQNNMIALSPDNKLLATTTSVAEINLWEFPSLQPIGNPLEIHTSFISSLEFNPDSNILASGSWDDSIILWDVKKHQPLGKPLTGHSSSIIALSFSPDGKTLASGSEDDTIKLWDLDPQSWIEQICFRAGRNFTYAEWTQYFPDEPYRVTCSQWPVGPKQ